MPNALQWNGEPGHYEVYYVTLTDPVTGVGVWIRYTMVAPLAGVGEPATCALWFLAMDPRPGRAADVRPQGDASDRGAASRASDPFELQDRRRDADRRRHVTVAFEDVAWDLRWTPAEHGYEHVHPVLRRAKVAQTVLVLPARRRRDRRARSAFAGERLELAGARGGQAHLWGSKHAQLVGLGALQRLRDARRRAGARTRSSTACR